MLQNRSGKISFTERFKLRGYRFLSLRQFGKRGYTHKARFLSHFFGTFHTVLHTLHLSRYEGNILPNYLSRCNMSRKRGATFPVFWLKVCYEGYFAQHLYLQAR